MSLNFLKRLTTSKKTQKLQNLISVQQTNGLMEQKTTLQSEIFMVHVKPTQEKLHIHSSKMNQNYS